jgi:hypothetical protein
MRSSPLLLFLLLPGCVRIGFDRHSDDGAISDHGASRAEAGRDAPSPVRDSSPPALDASRKLDLKVDLNKPDLVAPWDLGGPEGVAPACPINMASFPGFCIDLDQGVAQSWTAAGAACAGQGKRLCSVVEWQTACNSVGKGMLNMIGNWEWLAEIYSATDAGTSARKAGSSACSSLSYHDIGGSHWTRCCK